MNNSSNFTWYPDTAGFSHQLDDVLLKYAYVHCVLAPIIIVGNIVLIVTILYNRKLRRDLLTLSIVSIAVADLIVGILVSPVTAGIGFKQQFVHGCVVRTLVSVFNDYVHMFVSTWALVNMNTHYILKMCYVRTPYLTPLGRTIVFGSILALPWLAMLFIVLPVASAYAYASFLYEYCMIFLDGTPMLLVCTFVYLVPAVLMLIQVVVMTVVRLYRRNHATRIPATATTVDISPPWVLVAASAVTVLFLLFEQLVLVFSFIPHTLDIWLAGMAISDSKSAVLPFVWFFYSDIRTSFCELFNKLPCRRTEDVFKSDFKVSYKRSSDEVPEPRGNPI